MRWPASVFVVLVTAGLQAQVPLFQRLSEKDGLVFNEVHSMAFDRRGMLWVGTAMGLARYDGREFKTYTTADGLPAPRVYAIKVGQGDVLWLGTPKGLARLDPATDDIQHWRMDTTDRESLQRNGVRGLQPLANGKVLCASWEGIYLLDPGNGACRALRDEDGAQLKVITRLLLPDSAGQGCWLSSEDHGLLFFDARSEKVLRSGGAVRHPLLGIKATNMVRDHEGRIWTDDASDGGMNLYRPGDGHVLHWPHVPGRPGLRYPHGVLSMSMDPQGRIWIGDWEPPAIILDPRDHTVITLPFDHGDPLALPDYSVSAFAANTLGQMWVGTLSGIAVHDPSRFSYRTLLHKHIVPAGSRAPRGLAEDAEDRVWLLTDHDLMRLNDDGVVEQHIPLFSSEATGRALSMVFVAGHLYLSTNEGLLRADPATGHIDRVKEHMEETRTPPSFGRLVAGRSGLVWSFTRQGDITRFDPADGTFRRFAPGTALGSGQTQGVILDLIETADGTVWFGGELSGLVRMDPGTGDFETNDKAIRARRVSGTRVLSIAEDAAGHIWYSPDGEGLVRYSPAQGSYTTYDARHGMPIPAAGCIVPDGHGHLWVGLMNGLTRFDIASERFVSMDIDGGQRYLGAGRPLLMRRSGEIWLTVHDRIIRFMPTVNDMLPPPRPPVILQLSSFGESVTIPPDGRLSLDHTRDQLRIRFNTFDTPGRIVRYAVREGKDGPWSDRDRGDVTLDNIQDGPHHFQLRVMANDGQWSEPLDLYVDLVPPWWRTLWFRIVMASMLAISFVGFFRLRMEKVRQEEKHRGEVARTMDELKLRALRAQMDPHFIFNCLNSIDGYIVSNDPAKASHYLGRFAKLIRLILQYSDSTTIPLEREVEMLRYYLELEAQRFRTPFQFSVRMEEGLEDEAIHIPTMLVQPFVENAIWHGLQHKEGQGHLRIMFRNRGDDLVCTVEDDGIGREASRRINEGREKTHRSMGMRVSSDRLELLRTRERGTAHVEVSDLRDPTGTLVTIHIPLRREALDEQA
ncbi:MAG: histidine kinase [Flavobacteriales bacterium]|nr:histidine kinase [Flavobacteriales bacterium]